MRTLSDTHRRYCAQWHCLCFVALPATQMQMESFVVLEPPSAQENRPRPQHHQSHKVTEWKSKVVDAGVKAICHGPAMREFMNDLFGVKISGSIP